MPGKKKPQNETPTIRGTFLTGHVERLREERGERAVQALERRWDAPLYFGRLREIPVKDEARLLELIVDLDHTHGPAAREYLAGRLHFDNFSHSTLGSALLLALPQGAAGLTTLLRNAPSIVRFVFNHLEIKSEIHKHDLIVLMKNSEYPPEHFHGFFDALMGHCKLPEEVIVRVLSPFEHEYTLILP